MEVHENIIEDDIFCDECDTNIGCMTTENAMIWQILINFLC